MHGPAREPRAALDDGYTSALAQVECARTLDRLRLAGRLLDSELAAVIAAATSILARLNVLELDAVVLQRASFPFPTTVRTLDAIHLALIGRSKHGSRGERGRAGASPVAEGRPRRREARRGAGSAARPGGSLRVLADGAVSRDVGALPECALPDEVELGALAGRSEAGRGGWEAEVVEDPGADVGAVR